MAVAGDTEAALRSLSVLAGLATLFIAWRWAHEALGKWPGLIALLVVALSPLALLSARVARMYSLETAFATGAWWVLWRLLSGRASGRAFRWHAIALSVLVALEVWTTALGPPTAALQVLVAVGAWVYRRWRPSAIDARWAIASIVVGGLTFLPWLPNLLPIATSGRPYWTPPPGSFDWAVTWGTMVLGFRDDLPGFPEMRGVVLALLAIGIAWLVTRGDDGRRVLGPCVAAGASLTVAVWIVSLSRSIYDTRYLEASLPPLALGIAAGVEGAIYGVTGVGREAAKRLGRAAPEPSDLGVFAGRLLAAAFLLAALVPGSRIFLAEWRSESGLAPSRQLVATVEPQVRPGDVLLSLDARSYFTLAYESEMRRRRGEAVPAPIYNWDTGDEPFYRGQSLILPGATLTPAKVATGWHAAVPALSRNGSVWLIALANGGNEKLGFAPLDSGSFREVDRIVIQANGNVGQARRLELTRGHD